MTKAEITEESNKRKEELNTCTRRIENCGQAINTFGMLKDYYKTKTKEVGVKKFISLAGIIFSSILALIFLPTSILCCVISGLALIFSINRYFFFKDVEKKFEHCHVLFGNIVQHLNDKQLTYSAKVKLIMKEIIELENTLPDTKAKTNATSTAQMFTQVVEETDVTSL